MSDNPLLTGSGNLTPATTAPGLTNIPDILSGPAGSTVTGGGPATDPTAPLGGDTAPIAVGGGNPGAAGTDQGGGLLASATEYLVRGGLLFVGAGLVFIALAALLWQSKTVRVSVNNISSAAAKTATAAAI